MRRFSNFNDNDFRFFYRNKLVNIFTISIFTIFAAEMILKTI